MDKPAVWPPLQIDCIDVVKRPIALLADNSKASSP